MIGLLLELIGLGVVILVCYAIYKRIKNRSTTDTALDNTIELFEEVEKEAAEEEVAKK